MPRKKAQKAKESTDAPAQAPSSTPAQTSTPASDSVGGSTPNATPAIPFSISPPQASPQVPPQGGPRRALNCVIYVRTSTLEQSTGAQTQIELCTKAIDLAKKGDGKSRKIVEVIVDENASGDVLPEKRPRFPRILELIAAGKVDELWLHSRDRLSRNVDMLGYSRVILAEKGVHIRCLDDTEDQALGRVKDLFGEMELNKYREKSNQGSERALREGIAMFRPPFGYRSDDKGKLVVDEEKRAICQSILRALDAHVNPRKIALLYGVSDSLVRRMRKNPIYRTGEVWYAGKIAFMAEPILKDEEAVSDEPKTAE